MGCYTFTHVVDHQLMRDLSTEEARGREHEARRIARLAEVDARQLYRRPGYSSMHAFCVGNLHMSEDEAYRRIRAGRTGRKFPAIFPRLADGRLHLSAVLLLTPHLTPENAEALLTAAEHQSNAGIERLLAERFPQPDLPTLVQPVAPTQLAPAPVCMTVAEPLAPATAPAAPRARVKPLAPERFSFQATVSKETHEKYEAARALLGMSGSDADALLNRAFSALVRELEKAKLGAGGPPRRTKRRGAANVRNIPKAIRREVWQRDGGRCTYTSETGVRCTACSGLQFDHIVPVARGGETTAANLRVLCRAHNQYEAERVFGAGFMAEKREAAKLEADQSAKLAADRSHCDEVIPWLEAAGFRKADAQRGAARCIEMAGATLEARVLHAMRSLGRERFGHLTQRPGVAAT